MYVRGQINLSERERERDFCLKCNNSRFRFLAAHLVDERALLPVQIELCPGAVEHLGGGGCLAVNVLDAGDLHI
jgi:hypothetical protein